MRILPEVWAGVACGGDKGTKKVYDININIMIVSPQGPGLQEPYFRFFWSAKVNLLLASFLPFEHAFPRLLFLLHK